MIRRLAAAAVVSVVTCAASQAAAAAWTLEKGHGQVITTAVVSHSAKGYAPSGDVVNIPDYDKQTLDALIEYGVTDTTTVLFKPQLRRVDIQNGDETSGFGLTELGVRQRLSSGGPWILSAQVSGLIPGARNRDSIAQAGVVDGEGDARLLAGRAFKLAGKDAFVDLEGGYHLRLGDPPDEWRADATLGVRPSKAVLLLAQSFNVFSNGDGKAGFRRYQYHNVWLSAVWDVTPQWSLQAGVMGTAYGENALRERGATVAVWRRF
jgi:protein XagA